MFFKEDVDLGMRMIFYEIEFFKEEWIIILFVVVIVIILLFLKVLEVFVGCILCLIFRIINVFIKFEFNCVKCLCKKLGDRVFYVFFFCC